MPWIFVTGQSTAAGRVGASRTGAGAGTGVGTAVGAGAWTGTGDLVAGAGCAGVGVGAAQAVRPAATIPNRPRAVRRAMALIRGFTPPPADAGSRRARAR